MATIGVFRVQVTKNVKNGQVSISNDTVVTRIQQNVGVYTSNSSKKKSSSFSVRHTFFLDFPTCVNKTSGSIDCILFQVELIG